MLKRGTSLLFLELERGSFISKSPPTLTAPTSTFFSPPPTCLEKIYNFQMVHFQAEDGRYRFVTFVRARAIRRAPGSNDLRDVSLTALSQLRPGKDHSLRMQVGSTSYPLNDGSSYLINQSRRVGALCGADTLRPYTPFGNLDGKSSSRLLPCSAVRVVISTSCPPERARV